MPQLKVKAQPLRYLSLAVEHSIVVPYHGCSVRVPSPETFVLLKLLVMPKRKDEAKVRKDVLTAHSLGDFLLRTPEYPQRFLSVFGSLPRGWRKVILASVETCVPALAALINTSELR